MFWKKNDSRKKGIHKLFNKAHHDDAFLDESGKGNLLPLSGPLLTKTNGLYSSSFSMSAEFSKRFNMAAFPWILAYVMSHILSLLNVRQCLP